MVKSNIKQAFASAATTYDSVALLQRKVGVSLLQRAEVIGQVDTAVDLGCGTGFLIQELLEQKNLKAQQIVALDIAIPMLHTTRNKLHNYHSVNYLCADAEYLPFQSKSVDLVISNLSLQWCDELELALCDLKRILKPGGNLFFTTFGINTLHELKSAWKEVDDYQHVNSFYSAVQLTELLQKAGFKQIELEAKPYTSIYESVWDLMTELKQLGAQTVKEGCSKHLTTKTKMQRMICAYQMQDENSLIPATFEVITATAKA
jgi:malonyl-CoA O-methyltransferase